MGSPSRRLTLSLLAAAGLLGVAWGHGETSADVDVSGQVVTADGRPAAQVPVATTWIQRGERMAAPTQVASDGEGRFQLRIHRHAGEEAALLALDARRGQGCVAVVDSGASPAALTLVLRPLGTVVATLAPDPVDGAAPLRVSVWATPEGVRARVAGRMGRSDALHLTLPPGRYTLEAEGSEGDHLPWQAPVMVPPGGRVDLGRVRLEARGFTRLYGRAPPPLSLGETLGGGLAPLSLEAFAGRWLLVLVWDASQELSRYALSRAASLCREYAAVRDRFEVLALHVAGPADLKAAEATLAAGAGHTHGPGGDADHVHPPSHAGGLGLGSAHAHVHALSLLPFPVALDAGTCEAWGVRDAPRALVVDPAGRLLPGGERAFEQRLRGLR